MRLKNCKQLTRFQMATMHSFVRHIGEEKTAKNLLAFTQIDRDHSGRLDMEEMRCALEDLFGVVGEFDFTDDDIEDMFGKLDFDSSDLITYSQFLIATLDPELFKDENLLRRFFNELDSIQEGFLTKESIRVAMQREGLTLTDDYIELHVFERMLGLQPEDKIDFEMFKDKFFN